MTDLRTLPHFHLEGRNVYEITHKDRIERLWEELRKTIQHSSCCSSVRKDGSHRFSFLIYTLRWFLEESVLPSTDGETEAPRINTLIKGTDGGGISTLGHILPHHHLPDLIEGSSKKRPMILMMCQGGALGAQSGVKVGRMCPGRGPMAVAPFPSAPHLSAPFYLLVCTGHLPQWRGGKLPWTES